MRWFVAYLSSPGGALTLLLSINLLNYIDRYLPSAVLSSISRQMFPNEEKSEFLEGTLQSAFMFSFMIAAPFFGWLCRYYRRWSIVGWGIILWSLASAASGLAGLGKTQVDGGAGGVWLLVGTFGFLFASRIMVGLGEAAYGPSAPAILSDHYPEKTRGRVLSIFYAAIPVGSAMGYLLGGQLGWPNAFFWMLPPGILLGVLCFFAKDPQVKTHETNASKGKAAIWDLLRIRPYVLAVGGYILATYAVGGIAFWLPKYLITHRQAGAEASVNTMVGGIIALSGLSATLIGGWLADWLKPSRPGAYFEVSAFGLLLAAPFLIGAIYAPFPVAWFMIFSCCFGLMLCTGPINAIIMNVAPPEHRAQAMALCIFFIHALGDAISPPLMGWLNDATKDPNAGFLSLLVLLLAGSVIWALGSKSLALHPTTQPTK